MNGADANALAGIMLVVVIGATCCVAVVALAINLYIHYLLYVAAEAVPREHQKINPVLVWLLLIPLFQIIWNFFVFQQVSDSYKAYFDSRGATDVGDCGRNVGLAYSIVVAVIFVFGPAAGFLPPVLCVFAPLPIVALVLLVLYLMKLFELKRRIEADAQASTPVEVV